MNSNPENQLHGQAHMRTKMKSYFSESVRVVFHRLELVENWRVDRNGNRSADVKIRLDWSCRHNFCVNSNATRIIISQFLFEGSSCGFEAESKFTLLIPCLIFWGKFSVLSICMHMHVNKILLRSKIKFLPHIFLYIKLSYHKYTIACLL